MNGDAVNAQTLGISDGTFMVLVCAITGPLTFLIYSTIYTVADVWRRPKSAEVLSDSMRVKIEKAERSVRQSGTFETERILVAVQQLAERVIALDKRLDRLSALYVSLYRHQRGMTPVPGGESMEMPDVQAVTETPCDLEKDTIKQDKTIRVSQAE
jgi:hypothetical protein